MLPNLFLNIGAVHRKACITTPNVLEISKPSQQIERKKFVAINAKMFTVYDLAVNANPFKSWTLIFSSTGSRLRLSTRRINIYASKELGAESATMLKL